MYGSKPHTLLYLPRGEHTHVCCFGNCSLFFLFFLFAAVVDKLVMVDPGEKLLCLEDNFVCETVWEPVLVHLSCFFNLGGKVMQNSILHGLLSLFDRLV